MRSHPILIPASHLLSLREVASRAQLVEQNQPITSVRRVLVKGTTPSGGVGRIRTYVLINVAASATCIQPHKIVGVYIRYPTPLLTLFGFMRAKSRSMPLAHDDIRFVSDCSTPAFHRRRPIIASPRVFHLKSGRSHTRFQSRLGDS